MRSGMCHRCAAVSFNSAYVISSEIFFSDKPKTIVLLFTIAEILQDIFVCDTSVLEVPIIKYILD